VACWAATTGFSHNQSVPLVADERGTRNRVYPCAGVLVQEQYVYLYYYFLDGTKFEANANRYTFEWKKAVIKHQAKLQEKEHILFQYPSICWYKG
jgi:hypothetical protein